VKLTSNVALGPDKRPRWSEGGTPRTFAGGQLWWNNHDPDFKELLDTRGNRLGFPLEIVAELTALREHYQTKLHPKKSDPWSTVRVRS
jgi:hypothetical protein